MVSPAKELVHLARAMVPAQISGVLFFLQVYGEDWPMKELGIVERVGNALEAVQLFSRWNDWTSDRVEGMPIEICRHGAEHEDEIVVVKRFDASWKEDDALRVTIKDALARAAIEALRDPTEAMVEASAAIYGDDWRNRHEYSKDQWRAMVDAALKEQEKAG